MRKKEEGESVGEGWSFMVQSHDVKLPGKEQLSQLVRLGDWRLPDQTRIRYCVTPRWIINREGKGRYAVGGPPCRSVRGRRASPHPPELREAVLQLRELV
jgi:hypothetical protein